jgi:hypothetical protein
VELGASVDVQAADGLTSLHLAAYTGNVEVVATLVELGADFHAVDACGNTSLHLTGNAAIVTPLLETGAQLHRRNHHGITPLFTAIRSGHASVVTALVQAGARPEASNGEWWTSLLVGAVTGDVAAMEELFAASEELTWRMDENGQYARTAVQLAGLCINHWRQKVLHALRAPQSRAKETLWLHFTCYRSLCSSYYVQVTTPRSCSDTQCGTGGALTRLAAAALGLHQLRTGHLTTAGR